MLVRFGNSNGGDQALFDAIPRRQSTRTDYDGSTVGSSDLNLLAASATIPEVDLVLTTERTQMDRLRDLVIAGNTAQIGDPAFIAELHLAAHLPPASGPVRPWRALHPPLQRLD